MSFDSMKNELWKHVFTFFSFQLCLGHWAKEHQLLGALGWKGSVPKRDKGTWCWNLEQVHPLKPEPASAFPLRLCKTMRQNYEISNILIVLWIAINWIAAKKCSTLFPVTYLKLLPSLLPYRSPNLSQFVVVSLGLILSGYFNVKLSSLLPRKQPSPSPSRERSGMGKLDFLEPAAGRGSLGRAQLYLPWPLLRLDCSLLWDYLTCVHCHQSRLVLSCPYSWTLTMVPSALP